jgi:hypothetical protein
MRVKCSRCTCPSLATDQRNRPKNCFVPSGSSPAASAIVRIEGYTGASSNPPAVLLWTTSPILNNDGDRAELYSSSNVLVDSE